MKKDVPRNFAKFTGKQTLVPESLFSFFSLFFCQFWEISKSTIFTEHLWTIASVIQ